MEHSEATVVSEMGPFSIVPEWLLDSEVSNRALRLYALLGRYADRDGACWPSRQTLAKRLRCGTSALDLARAELEEVGAIEVTRRKSEDGGLLSNLYVVKQSRPGGVSHATGIAPIPPTREENDNQTSERDVLSATSPNGDVTLRRAAWHVDRKRVTQSEADLASDVLAAWNAWTGQFLRSRDWLAKIVMRVREHPELSLHDHVEIMGASLRDPWWKGAPTPSVVYGNGAQFERALLTLRSPSARDIAQAGLDAARRTT